MNETVSIMTMVCMAVAALAGFGIPVALFLYYRLKKRADIVPFFIGCAVMFVLALTIESMLHNVISATPAGAVIRGNIWLYALYGGAMAALFEEGGRFLAFRFLMKKYREKDINALMYGAGHGGIEAAVLLGTSMISNLVFAVMVNTGTFSLLTAGQPPEIVEQLEAAVVTLTTTSPALFLAGIVERVFAVILQLALSVVVWFGVKQPGKGGLVWIALLIHFAVDAISVLLAGSGVNTWLVETAVGVMAAAAAFYAYRLWKRRHTPQQAG